MTRRAILHIGTEKTGSTSIQQFLSHHRRWLGANGFHYAKAAGSPNHVRLFSYAVGNPRLAFGASNLAEHAKLRRKLENELAKERAAHPDATFLFSNEHCHSRLYAPEEIARLKALLDPLFDDVKVLVYLRRQDLVAVSLYSTLLKAGVSSDQVLVARPIPALPPHAPEQRLYYDYQALLARWGEAFGGDALIVRRFETGALVGGDIVADFCAAVGLPAPTQEAERANESLRPEYQEFLRLVNRSLKVEHGSTRSEIVRAVAALGKGSGRLPPRAEAEAFTARFAEGNEAIRRAHFPAAATLFDPDFARYPEATAPTALDLDAVTRLTGEVLRAMALDLQAAKGELALLRAQRLADEGSIDEAQAQLGRAIALRPGDEDALALRKALRARGRRLA